MAGSRLTIEDVARAAGVSRSTVSRVMNGVPGATESVRRHVKAVIAGSRPATGNASRSS